MKLKKDMRRLKYLVPWAVIVCLVLALLPFSIASAQDVTVRIDVPPEVSFCSNITARVSILNVTDLDSFQFKLSYNTSVLEVIGTEGAPQVVTDGLIDSTPITDHPWMFSPIGAPGTLFILGNVGGVLGADGDGYLCEVHFHVIGSPCNSSDLTFSEGKLFDTSGSGAEIPAIWVDGSVHVTAGVVVTGCMADPNPTKVGYSTAFSANASAGTPPYSWEWDFGDGDGSSVESPVHQYTAADTYTVNVTVTDTEMTQGTCSFNITVNPALDVSGCMADPNPTKVGYNTTFSATVTGGIGAYTYDWDFGDGNSSTLASPVYAYATANTYNVTLTVTDDRANMESCSFDLVVNPPLDVTGCMADPNPTRVGYNTTFTVNITGGLPPYIYDWDFGDGNSSAEAGPIHQYATVGSYNVTINVTDSVADADGCAFAITVNPPLDVTDCKADPNPTKVGYNTTFSANATGGVGTLTWDWDFGDGNSSAEVSPVYAYAAAANYSVTVTVTDDVGQESCSFNISVREALAVDFSADSGIVEAYPDPLVDPMLAYPTSGYVAGTTITTNTTFNFTNESTGGVGPYTYEWDFGDGNNSTDENPVYTYTVNATYNVSLTVTDSLANVETETKPDYLMAYRAGDANHNGVIDMADVTKVEREILRIDPPTIWADANVDHAINMADVTTI